MKSINHEFMKTAILTAEQSKEDVPVGAVIVKDNKIIATATNQREQNNDISAHAEILAIKKAEKILQNWRLENCDLYVTLEPCPMCAWAIIQARIKNVYFGSYDCQYGALGTTFDLRKQANSKLKVYGGIMEEECDNVLKDFWEKIRKE